MFKRGKQKEMVATSPVSEGEAQSLPDFHLRMKPVDAREVPPEPDDVLVCSELAGLFQFAQVMACGPTTYILIRKRLRNGAVEPVMHMAYEGTVYFRDLPPKTPRARLPEPTKHAASNIHRPGHIADETPSAATAATAVAAKPAKSTRSAKPKKTPTNKKRGRTRKSVA